MSLIERIEAMDRAITVSELAALLNLGKTAIYDMTRRSAIPHFRVAGLRFDPQEVADWLRGRSIQPPTKRERKH